MRELEHPQATIAIGEPGWKARRVRELRAEGLSLKDAYDTTVAELREWEKKKPLPEWQLRIELAEVLTDFYYETGKGQVGQEVWGELWKAMQNKDPKRTEFKALINAVLQRPANTRIRRQP